MFELEVEATSGSARTGRLALPHGTIETPCFMPVGTQGTVRALSPNDLLAAGAGLVPANTYHPQLPPREDVAAQPGGLPPFMAWGRPPPPERAIEIQGTLGAHVARAFARVVQGVGNEPRARDALERTRRGLNRCGKRHRKLVDSRLGGQAVTPTRLTAYPTIRQTLWPIL